MGHLLLGIITLLLWPGFGLGIVPIHSCQLSKYQILLPIAHLPPTFHAFNALLYSIAFRLYCDWWIPVHHVLLTAAVPDFSRDKSTSYKFQISISDTFDISLRAIRPPQASLTNWGVELHRTSSDVHNPCPQVINKSRYHFTPKVKKLLVMWNLLSYSEVDGIPRV